MRITAIETQMKNLERVNIFVDGHFLMGATAILVAQMDLAPEQELTPAQLAHLQSEEALQQAVDRVLNYLSFRPHSRQEIRLYLRRKQTPPEIIEAAMEKLDRMKLIDDEAFAAFWVESRERFSPRGARAMRNELRAKGIDRDTASEAVNDEQDEGRAMEAGRKKAYSLVRIPGIDLATFRNRLGSFLARRGFDYSISRRTVQALWQELGPKAEDEDNFDEEE